MVICDLNANMKASRRNLRYAKKQHRELSADGFEEGIGILLAHALSWRRWQGWRCFLRRRWRRLDDTGRSDLQCARWRRYRQCAGRRLLWRVVRLGKIGRASCRERVGGA